MQTHLLRRRYFNLFSLVAMLVTTAFGGNAQQDPPGTRGSLSDAYPAKPAKKVSATSAMRGRRPGKSKRPQFYHADGNFPEELPSGGRSLATIGVTIVRGRVATEAEIVDRTIATVQGCVKWTDDKCVERKSMVLPRILDDAPVSDGDQIQMTIEFLSYLAASGQQTNRIAYLYVINREQYPDESWGEPKLIFPTLRTYGGDNRVLPGKTVTLPAPNRPWTISRSTSGRQHAFETYTIIVSPQPLTDLLGQPLDLKDHAIALSAELVNLWIRKWGGNESRGVLENGVGQLISQREAAASGKVDAPERGTKDDADDLSLDDPAPQIVFRKIVNPNDKLLVTIKLPFKEKPVTAQDGIQAWKQLQETIDLLMQVRKLYEAGQYDEAIPLAQKAFDIERRVVKDEQFFGADFSFDLLNYPSGALARLYHAKGDYVRAEAEYQRMVASADRSYSKLPAAHVRSGLAAVYESKGEYERALELRIEANDIIEQYLTYRFSPRFVSKATDVWGALSERATRDALAMAGSDSFRRGILDAVETQAFETVSLHLRFMPQDIRAAQLALMTILRRKGRLASTSGEHLNVLRRYGNEADQQLITELTRVYANIAAIANTPADVMSFTGDDIGKGKQLNATLDQYVQKVLTHHDRVRQLEREVDALEGKINQRSAELRPVEAPASLAAVRQALPPDAALVELFVYEPFDPQGKRVRYPNDPFIPSRRARLEFPGSAYEPPRYVAYVLHQNKETPMAVDLGPVAEIDPQVIQLREALRHPGRADVKEVARALDERIMRPVRKLLGSTRRLFIVPDGNLTLVPFSALVSENNKYLLEDYSISYLTGWRDLVRRESPANTASAAGVFGNPDFVAQVTSTGGVNGYRKGRATVSSELSTLNYEELPGTALEVSAVSKLFPDAAVETRGRATEAALKSVKRPRFLHIATHGFFLADEENEAETSSRFVAKLDAGLNTAARNNFPLLRSGLILAGVNKRSSGPGEDGVLTALEVSGLDLLGTKLVVLSACDTGLGAVKNGEGVFGLRRALVIAGSETQVMSLWRVSDAAARDLMVGYYARLKKGEGRGEALRQVQLAMLQRSLAGSEQGGRTRETGDKIKGPAERDYSHPYYWAAFIVSGEVRDLAGDN